MARAVRWGMEVTLSAAVDVEEGGTYSLCARQSPDTVRARRQTCGVTMVRATTVEVGLSLLREAVAAKDRLGARWMAADGGYASRTFVEGVRALDLHAVGRLRKDAVLRFPYTGLTNGDRAAAGSSTAATRRTWPARRGGGPVPRGRPADNGGGALVQHRPGLGTGTHLSVVRCPFPERVCLPRCQAAPGPQRGSRPAPRPNCTFISTLSSPPSSGPVYRPVSRQSAPSAPFSCAIASGTISRRKYTNALPPGRARAQATNSEGRRHRIPPQRLWLRTPPLAPGPTRP